MMTVFKIPSAEPGLPSLVGERLERMVRLYLVGSCSHGLLSPGGRRPEQGEEQGGGEAG